jgi:membrane-associated phospholipid phosphatase
MDLDLFRLINGVAGRSPGMDWVWLQLGYSSTLLVPGLLLLAYWLWRARREALIAGPVLIGVVIGGDFLGAQLKLLVQRARPCQVLQTVQQLTVCGATFSFPSNHALNTAAVAAFAQLLYPRSGWLMWPVVTLAGISRIYVGAHYPSDVLGGWIIGGLLGASIGLLTKRLLRIDHRTGLQVGAKVPR